MNLDGILTKLMASPIGRTIAAKAGLPEAVTLRRGRRMPTGPVALGLLSPSDRVAAALELLGVATTEPLLDDPSARTTDANGREQAPTYPTKLGAVLIDATGASAIGQLERLRAIMRPALRAIEPSGRVIIVGSDPSTTGSVEAAAVQQALDGVMRSIGKELRSGATCNLVQVTDATTADGLAQVLSFLLEGRSAYVNGQPLLLDGPTGPIDPQRVVVVTGAARGIGAAIARTFARDGARVVCVDVPVAGEALAHVANEIRGTALQLDITAADAGAQIARHVVGRFGADARIASLVHCAGILRDKMLVNMDEKRWAAVLEVNLAAQLRINATLLDPATSGGIGDGARLIGVASTSGWAGNKGQTNYAASKAGVIGMVRALAPELADRGIVVNGVAPGFIETDMTASIPFVEREIFRRSSSLLQGGQPVDVAEAICFLADPRIPINGQVLRVCGQLIVGR